MVAFIIKLSGLLEVINNHGMGKYFIAIDILVIFFVGEIQGRVQIKRQNGCSIKKISH